MGLLYSASETKYNFDIVMCTQMWRLKIMDEEQALCCTGFTVMCIKKN